MSKRNLEPTREQVQIAAIRAEKKSTRTIIAAKLLLTAAKDGQQVKLRSLRRAFNVSGRQMRKAVQMFKGAVVK